MNAIPHATVTTPGGEELVLVPRAAFEAMQDRLDAAAHAESMAAVARGEQELLTAEEVRAALLEATPLAFWRKKRGLTQTALAADVGIKQGFLSEVEAGKKMGDPPLYRRLARALRVRMEDLVPEG
ncbi:MAG: helix-turn-helix transcriptional regulator [Bosea sp.]|uniref:helix-turn-helix domain-containing protein n=1 Tax=Bosea sp. (in: a-proteobacteria) TaxID=1871050 RepID=UPI0023A1F2C8|nr:helix-turn-helix transcriptional regulator [Bosea sp. (in: a-proteobacteria)]MCP4738469.1 helix-turn-helix transcriptional regulator [Bosea sp. (in: a-proteobacteria)]